MGDQLQAAERREALATVLHHVLVMPGSYGPSKIKPVPRWE
jgi:hypothetical protein